MPHAVSSSRVTRLLQNAPADDHATRALFSGGAFSNETLPAGTVLNGRYTVTRVLGRGGFGVTYEARDENGGSIFAIKEFFPPGCARVGGEVVAGATQTAERLAASRRRSIEEARVLAALRHPNLVRVFGAFEERGTAFLVMEKLRGETLLEVVEKRGALPETLVLKVAEKLCEALDALHRVGFLHLDVKPENVFACDFDDDEKRRIVLMDFDLLRPLGGETERITQPLIHATHCGTPGYAPIEQYSQSAILSRETDVYALGATLFHLLTGDAPSPSTDRAATGAELSGARYETLSASTREALSLAMQTRPRDRPASARDFLAVLNGETVSAKTASTRGAISGASPRRATGVLPASQLLKNPTSPLSVAAPSPASTGGAAVRDEIHFARTPKGAAVQWPDFCPCCGDSPDNFLELKSGDGTLRAPYCGRCKRHVAAQKIAMSGMWLGVACGMLLAALGFALSVAWIGLLGVVVHFSALSYGALQTSHADSLTPPQCCSVDAAVKVQTKNARFWQFKSGRYAEEFRKLNS